MNFYSMSYPEVLALPLRTFWSLNAQITRLRAEEQLGMIEMFMLGGMGASGEVVKELRQMLSKQMGDPVKVSRNKQIDDAATTQEGMKKLRELKSRMVP